MQRTYIAIDLKSFYASVECMDRGLDPMNTNLVVADERRTEKTICLAVSPSLKSYGIRGGPGFLKLCKKSGNLMPFGQVPRPAGNCSGLPYIIMTEKKTHPLQSII